MDSLINSPYRLSYQTYKDREYFENEVNLTKEMLEQLSEGNAQIESEKAILNSRAEANKTGAKSLELEVLHYKDEFAEQGIL